MKTLRMRYVSALLGLTLLFMVGGIVLVMAMQPGTPVAQRSPSSFPSSGATATDLSPPPGSPSPTLTPTLTPTDAPTDAPSAPPSGEPSSNIPPEFSPSPEPPPTPTPTPVAPTREITFVGLGLDNPDSPEEEQVTPRFFSFNAEGPGVIRVQLSRVSARIRACIGQGDPAGIANPVCRTQRRGELTREIPAGIHRWTVSLIGGDATGSPSATVRISFPTNDVAIRLAGFRFQGEGVDDYNGFAAELRAAGGGPINVSGELDDGEGGLHPYRLVVQEVGGGPAQPHLFEDEGRTFARSVELTAERSYLISLENRDSVSELLILLTADLDWP